MKNFLSLIALFAMSTSIALAQDFSLSPLVPKQPILTSSRCSSSIPISVLSATTTQLIAINANALPLHVCKITSSAVATAPTMLLEYGTGSSCGTGTTALTGTYVVTSGTIFNSSVQIDIPASQALCLVTGGTGSPSFQGVLEYGYW